MATPNEYLQRSACFACLPERTLLTLFVRLTADKLLVLNPMADVTPNALLARSQCYACLPQNILLTIVARLLADIAEAPSTPAGSGTVLQGAGNPEGVAVASPGAWYLDTLTNFVYFKVSGAGNTGWKLIA